MKRSKGAVLLAFAGVLVQAQDERVIPGAGITGEVRYHRDVYSPQLDNRRHILVWLPPSYGTDTTRTYPVLYMHDGQNVMDPATSFLGKDWRVDEVADSLIRSGEMEEIIVVAITNTDDRMAEYSPLQKGQSYSRFLVETVKPFIDQTYRTKPEREHTAVMGSSMGGLISFHLAWDYEHVFSKAACLSPAFLVDRYEAVKRVRRYRGSRKDVRIYIDNGTEDLEARLHRGVTRMVRALKRRGFREGEDLVVVIEDGAQHNEMAWAGRIHVPLKWFFGLKE